MKSLFALPGPRVRASLMTRCVFVHEHFIVAPQSPLSQSPGPLQLSPTVQSEQTPPQSISLSSWFLMPSVHDTTQKVFAHALERQSEAMLQCKPVMHLL